MNILHLLYKCDCIYDNYVSFVYLYVCTHVGQVRMCVHVCVCVSCVSVHVYVGDENVCQCSVHTAGQKNSWYIQPKEENIRLSPETIYCPVLFYYYLTLPSHILTSVPNISPWTLIRSFILWGSERLSPVLYVPRISVSCCAYIPAGASQTTMLSQ